MPGETRKDERTAFVGTLKEFNDQREWYSKRAGQLKTHAQRLDLLTIALGALVAALPIIKPGGEPHFIEIIVSFSWCRSSGYAGCAADLSLWRDVARVSFGSERMKREQRMFTNAVGPYNIDDGNAQSLYVARLEEIIEDEQKIFFDRRRQDDESNRS